MQGLWRREPVLALKELEEDQDWAEGKEETQTRSGHTLKHGRQIQIPGENYI
jgi:hypothetical protein